MSNRVFKLGRCARCGKRREDDVHDVDPSPGLLHRILHIAWPRWAWRSATRHQFVDRDTMVAVRDGMAEAGRWFERARRRG